MGGARRCWPHRSRCSPYDEPGWIINKEAKSLFSPMDDQYAFGEMDEVGKQNIARFAASTGDGCLFEFMPVEGLLHPQGNRRELKEAQQ